MFQTRGFSALRYDLTVLVLPRDDWPLLQAYEPKIIGQALLRVPSLAMFVSYLGSSCLVTGVS